MNAPLLRWPLSNLSLLINHYSELRYLTQEKLFKIVVFGKNDHFQSKKTPIFYVWKGQNSKGLSFFDRKWSFWPMSSKLNFPTQKTYPVWKVLRVHCKHVCLPVFFYNYTFNIFPYTEIAFPTSPATRNSPRSRLWGWPHLTLTISWTFWGQMPPGKCSQ